MTGDVRHDLVALLPRLRRFAYSLAGTLDEADDLVQAACERALSRLDQFKPGTRLDSWMFRIVQSIWIDRMRASSRRNNVSDPTVLEALQHDARIYETTEARSALEIVRAAVSRLPEEQRVVLALCAVDGLSYQQAADVLEVPIGTIMSRLSRARRKLAEALEAPADSTRAKVRGP